MGEYRLPEETRARTYAALLGWAAPAEEGIHLIIDRTLEAALNLSDDPVERIARALAKEDGWNFDAMKRHEGATPEPSQEGYTALARAALQALGLHEPEGEERT